MGYYTPDWIHLRSEWDFFIPPLAALVISVILGIFFFVYPRRFPKEIIWRQALMVLAFLATGVLYFFAITQRFYSVHVVDFVRNGVSNKEILADIQQSAKITLPSSTAISMAVTAGGRDYTTWYGMKIDPEPLIGYLRQLNYKETTYYETGPYQRLEPLTLWKKETDFAPTLTLDAWNGGTYNIIQIDQKHGLALIEVVDS